jgi:hypothetical protein
MIAKRIIEEIQLTPWNLSQNFLYCKNQQARMYLRGIGDPMCGLGGINYIKMPQKISKYENFLLKKDYKNRSNDIVTGTNSDLRKLSMKNVHAKLKLYGYTEENLNRLERWDKIEILRDLANEQSSNAPYDDDLSMFSRNLRMTTEKQKEHYQKDINQIFMKSIDILSQKGKPKQPFSENKRLQRNFGIGIEGVVKSIRLEIDSLKDDLIKVKEKKKMLINEKIEERERDIRNLDKMKVFIPYCNFVPSEPRYFNANLIDDIWWMFKETYKEVKAYKLFDQIEKDETKNARPKKVKQKAIVLKPWISQQNN